MKVILQQNLPGTGKKGDVKDVAEGHARNFLLPKKLAILATPGAISVLQRQKAKDQNQSEAEVRKAKSLAEQLKGKSVTVTARASVGGKLYAAVTSTQIADVLNTQGFPIVPAQIRVAHLKAVGEHMVEVEVGHGVRVLIKVIVNRE